MTKYAQLYAQQAQLEALFRATGYHGQLPQFLKAPTAPGSDHPLLAWLAANFRLEDHYMTGDEVARARQLEDDSLAVKAQDAADTKLAQFEEADDLSTCIDQDAATAISSEQHAWLEEETLEDLDQRLQGLAEERALYKAQIQELHALEQQLDSTHRASRTMQSAAKAAVEDLQADIASEQAAIEKMNTQFNALLDELQELLQDVKSLSQQHSQQWLMLVNSGDKQAYLNQSIQLMEVLTRCNLQQQQAGSYQLAKEPQTPLMPEDDPDWLARNDPFALSSASAPRIHAGLDKTEVQHMMQELTLLAIANKQTEYSCIKAKLRTAQHTAELEMLRKLVREGNAMPSAVDEAQQAALLEELSQLEAEEERLTTTVLPGLLEHLNKQQEAHVLKGHYDLQLHVLVEQVQRRAVAFRTLLEHTAWHQMIQAVQVAEHNELQSLYATAQRVEELLGSIVAAATSRCSLYAATANPSQRGPAAPASALHQHQVDEPGTSCREDRFVALLGQLLQQQQQQQGGQQQGLDRQQAAMAVGQQLQGLQRQGKQALAEVSGTLYEELRKVIGPSRTAVQDAHQLLFPQQAAAADASGSLRWSTRSGGTTADGASAAGGEGPNGGVPKITLHPQELGAKLIELSRTASEVNELINEALAETSRVHASKSENKEESEAERAVLEWFYLQPHKLYEHVAGVEQRVASMRQ